MIPGLGGSSPVGSSGPRIEMSTRPEAIGAVPHKPWYRYFWPWILIALPLASVLGGVTTLLIAMKDPDSLVVGDYYKEGLAINRSLAKEDRARSMGLAAHLRVDLATGDILLRLNSDKPVPADRLQLKFFHTTRAERDVETTLQPLTPGRYAGSIAKPLSLGGWLLNLGPVDDAWRVAGRTHVTPDSTGAVLTADLRP